VDKVKRRSRSSGAGLKSLFASFSSEKDESSFLKKEAKNFVPVCLP
jgi:hypothetical protein